jgi:hypothetical protein
MPRRGGSVLSIVVAAFATPVFAFTFTPLSSRAHAAADCITAPESLPPQGSRWHYRTDRATQQKCWYLAPQRVQNTASPVVTERTPPQSVTRPITSGADELFTPSPRPEPGTAWPKVNAAETAPVTPPVVQRPDPPANIPERAASGEEHAGKEIQDAAALDERLAQESTVAAVESADSLTVANIYFLLFVSALAIIGLLVRPSINMAAARRRRANVHITDLEKPRFVPLKELIHQYDEVEEALRQLSQLRNRRAA